MKKVISACLMTLLASTLVFACGDDKKCTKSCCAAKTANAEAATTPDSTAQTAKPTCNHNHGAEAATPTLGTASKTCDKTSAGKPCCASHAPATTPEEK